MILTGRQSSRKERKGQSGRLMDLVARSNIARRSAALNGRVPTGKRFVDVVAGVGVFS